MTKYIHKSEINMELATNFSPWRFCIAPMMQCTDRHFRYLARRLSRHARLYTEMVVASALLRGDAVRFLAHDASEAPVALQLGGSEPRTLASAARMGEAAGYCEINLNVGCPSDRVQSGRFGACLMAEPALVADCVAAMRAAVRLPVTVKTRLGIDELDSYEHLYELITALTDAGCGTVILHARKALLRFSPRQNRAIPPLDYARVYRIKREFPALTVVINGGISTLAEGAAHLAAVDGVMLGRRAYEQPFLLGAVDAALFDDPRPPPTRGALVEAIIPYVERACAEGVPLTLLTKHLLGLWQGQPGARRWRRFLSERAPAAGASPDLLRAALVAAGACDPGHAGSNRDRDVAPASGVIASPDQVPGFTNFSVIRSDSPIA